MRWINFFYVEKIHTVDIRPCDVTSFEDDNLSPFEINILIFDSVVVI